MSSSQDHVKNFPSTPSESASWLEKNPPPRMPHLAEQVLERLGRDPAVAILAGDEPCARVQLRQLRVVVEHLLEVGD
ncbi:MAG TPA: hypothetical protein VGZ51_05830, partial [Actinomycetota bacterium]|nr:hypothetical protein [Actinomycetota bacterium]